MKISEIQQTSHPRQVEQRTETDAGSQGLSHGTRPRKGDLVELASSLEPGATRAAEEMRARRVASLKARVQEGTYRVDARLVARKMLSDSSGG